MIRAAIAEAPRSTSAASGRTVPVALLHPDRAEQPAAGPPSGAGCSPPGGAWFATPACAGTSTTSSLSREPVEHAPLRSTRRYSARPLAAEDRHRPQFVGRFVRGGVREHPRLLVLDRHHAAGVLRDESGRDRTGRCRWRAVRTLEAVARAARPRACAARGGRRDPTGHSGRRRSGRRRPAAAAGTAPISHRLGHHRVRAPGLGARSATASNQRSASASSTADMQVQMLPSGLDSGSTARSERSTRATVPTSTPSPAGAATSSATAVSRATSSSRNVMVSADAAGAAAGFRSPRRPASLHVVSEDRLANVQLNMNWFDRLSFWGRQFGLTG